MQLPSARMKVEGRVALAVNTRNLTLDVVTGWALWKQMLTKMEKLGQEKFFIFICLSIYLFRCVCVFRKGEIIVCMLM